VSIPRRVSRPTTAFRAAGAALVGTAAVVALTGCSLSFQDDICSNGEYPVLTVNGTGSACVTDDEKPPAGYTRYPEGKVPQQVDDEWDVYWRTHTVDKDGNIIDAPDAQ
jgi:hypothetical protein